MYEKKNVKLKVKIGRKRESNKKKGKSSLKKNTRKNPTEYFIRKFSVSLNLFASVSQTMA